MARIRFYKVVGGTGVGRVKAKIVATNKSSSSVQKMIRQAKRNNKTLLVRRVSRDTALSLASKSKKPYRIQRDKGIVSRRIF